MHFIWCTRFDHDARIIFSLNVLLQATFGVPSHHACHAQTMGLTFTICFVICVLSTVEPHELPFQFHRQ